VVTGTFRLMNSGSGMQASIKVTRLQGTDRIILGVSIIDSRT